MPRVRFLFSRESYATIHCQFVKVRRTWDILYVGCSTTSHLRMIQCIHSHIDDPRWYLLIEQHTWILALLERACNRGESSARGCRSVLQRTLMCTKNRSSILTLPFTIRRGSYLLQSGRVGKLYELLRANKSRSSDWTLTGNNAPALSAQ